MIITLNFQFHAALLSSRRDKRLIFNLLYLYE